jgi:histone H2A
MPPKNANKKKKAGVSKAKRAGILVAPSRARKIIAEAWQGDKRRVSAMAPVYLAALLEGLCTYILSDACNVCLERKRKCVTSKHVGAALRTDPLLRQTHLGRVMITGQWQEPDLRRVQLVAKKAQV